MDKALQKEWEVFNIEEIDKIAENFSNAVKQKDLDEISRMMQDRKVLRSLIVSRGAEGCNLKMILNGLEILLASKNMKLDESVEKVLNVLQIYKISPDFIYLFAETAFHLRESVLFEKLSKIVFSQKEKIGDKAFYYMLHTDASWQAAKCCDSEKALAENLETINWAKKNDPVLYLKAKFGLTYNKKLLPKDKARDFNEIAEQMENYGDLVDAFRAKSESARSYLDIAKQQWIDDIAFDSLEYAKEIALEALRIAKTLGYPNLEINASEVLGGIYAERIKKITLMQDQIGKNSQTPKEFTKKYKELASAYKDDLRKNKSFHARVEELRKKYKYETVFNKRYKDTHFSHI